MNEAFIDYFRCPEIFAKFTLDGEHFDDHSPGYFTFGSGATLYGRSVLPGSDTPAGKLPDASEQIRIDGAACVLPFDPTEVATNLRNEIYAKGKKSSAAKRIVRTLYYALRPLFPTWLRRHFQRLALRGWGRKVFPQWPVDRSVDLMFGKLMAVAINASPDRRVPFIWFWPEGHSACAIMTHDVETAAGLKFTRELMAIDASYKVPSSFQVIPGARYTVTPAILSAITSAGFEVNVHDLTHDGHLFDDHAQFQRSADKINQFVARFESKGFRSGALYRNQAWFERFDFAYDMSVPNVAHLDPQHGGCCTVMPYFIGEILELPVTATQDYSLFHILESYSQDLWRQQIDLVLQQHGLLNFIVHPDYLDTPQAHLCYTGLLAEFSRLREEAGLWVPLPGEVDTWWRQRNKMRLVRDGQDWILEGEGSERARVAYATLLNGELAYVFPDEMSAHAADEPSVLTAHAQLA